MTTEIHAAMRDVDARAATLLDQSTTVLCLTSVIGTQLTAMNEQAALVTTRAHDIAERSREAAVATAQIRAEVDGTLETVRALGTQAQEIASVSASLSRLALEARMVGLNAAIEAAHAGEAGRGFAVVAEKVRELADGANDAAERIVSRLRSIRAAAVTSEDVMTRLSATVGTIDGHAAEIASAAGGQREHVAEMATGIAHLGTSVDEIVRATENITEAGMAIGEDARKGLATIEVTA